MTLNAQVGIGTTTPDASSILEMSSTTQGALLPRMTTAQRQAIVSPANGLVVYDTDSRAICTYDTATTAWIKSDSRLKFKRIKSTDVLATVLASEKAAGGGSKYLLDSQTLYEINGAITMDLPIELNSAYVCGFDSFEDKLIRAGGDLFTGSTGGTIRTLTITVTGGKAFSLAGSGTQSLILRDAIVSGCSNVGTIDNFFYIFKSIVLYTGNAEGIVYKNLGKLLLSNISWFSNNAGTYEKLEGNFGIVLKQGGFSEVTGTNTGFDVSANPVITGDAVLEAVVFTGALTTGSYVNKYTTGSYVNYNFTNNWTVKCTGIPTEGDAVTTGGVYFDRTQSAVNFTPNATNSTPPYTKIPGVTIAENLFRMGTGTSPVSSASNRLQYVGKKARYFDLDASLSFQSTSGTSEHVFFFVKFNSSGVATVLTSSESYIDTDSGRVQNVSVIGTVLLNTGDYVELHAARIAGESSKVLTVKSFNISME